MWTADADAVVKMTGAQTVAGAKTFTDTMTVTNDTLASLTVKSNSGEAFTMAAGSNLGSWLISGGTTNNGIDFLATSQVSGQNLLTITGNPLEVRGDISPLGVYDLGSASAKWANIYATNFIGSGASLTDLNADEITSGTVANTRLGDIKVANSTGVLTGGVLSIGAGTNTYSISDGTGVIVDENGLLTSVSWSGKTDIVPTNLGSALLTWVSIDSGGNVSEHIVPCDANMKRSQICLGVIVHVNLSTVDAVNNEQVIAYNPMSSVYDLASAIGFMNISGNVFSPNGANLNFDKTIGDIFATGSNYPNDANDPHVKSLPALTALTFQYRFSDGSNGTTGTPIDPDNLDDGAGGLTAVGNNKWSVQRIYSFISNNVKLQRGVSDYSDKSSAFAGLFSEPFITEPSIEANGLLRGWLVVKKGATDLSDSAEAEFIPAGKFGGGGGGTGGGGGGSGTTFADTAFRITDEADNTKEIAFEASSITTGNTRTFTAPDASGTLVVSGSIGPTEISVGYSESNPFVITSATNVTIDIDNGPFQKLTQGTNTVFAWDFGGTSSGGILA